MVGGKLCGNSAVVRGRRKGRNRQMSKDKSKLKERLQQEAQEHADQPLVETQPAKADGKARKPGIDRNYPI